jgi:hypothetical protein
MPRSLLHLVNLAWKGLTLHEPLFGRKHLLSPYAIYASIRRNLGSVVKWASCRNTIILRRDFGGGKGAGGF